jgi:hypothetical protein
MLDRKIRRRRNDPRTVVAAGGPAQGGTSSVDSLNVALHPLLDHIATRLAAEYVRHMEIVASSEVQEERGA